MTVFALNQGEINGGVSSVDVLTRNQVKASATSEIIPVLIAVAAEVKLKSISDTTRIAMVTKAAVRTTQSTVTAAWSSFKKPESMFLITKV